MKTNRHTIGWRRRIWTLSCWTSCAKDTDIPPRLPNQSWRRFVRSSGNQYQRWTVLERWVISLLRFPTGPARRCRICVWNPWCWRFMQTMTSRCWAHTGFLPSERSRFNGWPRKPTSKVRCSPRRILQSSSVLLSGLFDMTWKNCATKKSKWGPGDMWKASGYGPLTRRISSDSIWTGLNIRTSNREPSTVATASRTISRHSNEFSYWRINTFPWTRYRPLSVSRQCWSMSISDSSTSTKNRPHQGSRLFVNCPFPALKKGGLNDEAFTGNAGAGVFLPLNGG